MVCVDAVDAVSGCCQQVVTQFVQLPAGIGDARHLLEGLSLHSEQSILRAGIQFSLVFQQRQHLATQSFMHGQVGIYRGEADAEDTIVRSSPDEAMPVVGNELYVVGTQTVVLRDAEDFLAVFILEDDTLAVRRQCFEIVFAQLLDLVDMSLSNKCRWT